MVEESEYGPGGLKVTNRFWPGTLQDINPTDVTDVFLRFGDEATGQSILMATYQAAFGNTR